MRHLKRITNFITHTLRRCGVWVLINKRQKAFTLPVYVRYQTMLLEPNDFVSAIKALSQNTQFQARTDNVDDWALEVYRLNQAYTRGESLRPYIRGSGQHTVSANSYMSDKEGNYIDGAVIIPLLLESINTLTNHYDDCVDKPESRSINSAFILEHYLHNVRETLDAWLRLTYRVAQK